MVRIKSTLVVAALAILLTPAIAHAQQSQSTNYQVNEVYFGPGGSLNSSSANYSGQQTVEGAAGGTSSTNYKANGGFNTSDTPLLEVTVNGGTYDLGILDAATVKSAAASFSVRNYNGSGYIVQVAGTTLKQANGATIANMATAAASTPGTAQFGFNLKQNTTPSVGAEPQQQPDSTFAYGTPSVGYNTANQFKFVSGDTVASSAKESGKTLYTMSFIGNVSRNTAAGQYGAKLSVIVTPTF